MDIKQALFDIIEMIKQEEQEGARIWHAEVLKLRARMPARIVHSTPQAKVRRPSTPLSFDDDDIVLVEETEIPPQRKPISLNTSEFPAPEKKNSRARAPRKSLRVIGECHIALDQTELGNEDMINGLLEDKKYIINKGFKDIYLIDEELRSMEERQDLQMYRPLIPLSCRSAIEMLGGEKCAVTPFHTIMAFLKKREMNYSDGHLFFVLMSDQTLGMFTVNRNTSGTITLSVTSIQKLSRCHRMNIVYAPKIEEQG